MIKVLWVKRLGSVALKSIVFWMVLFLSLPKASATEPIKIEKLTEAIYHAENSVKFPYGIKSINTHGNKEYAKKICINSIHNALKRWNNAGQPEDFITFMGRRFSPPNLNPNWVRLVHYFYERSI